MQLANEQSAKKDKWHIACQQAHAHSFAAILFYKPLMEDRRVMDGVR
jgi:hypothetical protein